MEFDRKLDSIIKRTVARHRVAQAGPPTAPPFPAEAREFLERFVYWPHAQTGLPVCSLNPMQVDFLERTGTFRWSDDGACQGWSSIVGKARQVRMTSLGWGLMIHAALWFGRRGVAKRFVMLLHSALPKFVAPHIRNVKFMLSRLPQAWVGGWRFLGTTLELPGGGVIEIATAGHSEAIADQVGRSGSISGGIWASELAMYAQPQATLSAARSAMQVATGWLVAESTAGEDPDGLHAVEWRLADQGSSGLFDESFFWPWYLDPLKRLGCDSAVAARVMSEEFTATLTAADRAREAELRAEGLDDEQIAWRRKERFTGTADKRRAARRENPETFEEPYENFGESWLDAAALEVCKARARAPVHRERWGAYSCSIFVEEPTETVVFGGDCAAFGGKDRTALVGRGCVSGEQYATIHGHGLPTDFANALVWLVTRWFGRVDKRGAYVVAWESNHGKGHIEACRRAGLHLWSELVVLRGDRQKARHHQRKRRRFGFLTTGASRPMILSSIARGYEGGQLDDAGQPRALGPTVATYDRYLVEEIASLRVGKGGKVEGHPHDDLAIADGIALHIAPTIKDALGSSPGGVYVPSVKRYPRRSITRQGPT